MKTLYDEAQALENLRNYYSKEIEEELADIREEISLHIKITQQEIFTIGKLLSMAKSKCQQGGKNFTDWVEMNFDFSYKTAQNFMHVYNYCKGIPVLSHDIPQTVLYKVCTPSFPEELRECILSHGKDDINGKNLSEIKDIYKNGGVEAVEKYYADTTCAVNGYQNLQFTTDFAKKGQQNLDELLKKIDHRLNLFNSPDSETHQTINNLLDALSNASEQLQAAINEAENKIKELEPTVKAVL